MDMFNLDLTRSLSSGFSVTSGTTGKKTQMA